MRVDLKFKIYGILKIRPYKNIYNIVPAKYLENITPKIKSFLSKFSNQEKNRTNSVFFPDPLWVNSKKKQTDSTTGELTHIVNFLLSFYNYLLQDNEDSQ